MKKMSFDQACVYYAEATDIFVGQINTPSGHLAGVQICALLMLATELHELRDDLRLIAAKLDRVANVIGITK